MQSVGIELWQSEEETALTDWNMKRQDRELGVQTDLAYSTLVGVHAFELSAIETQVTFLFSIECAEIVYEELP